jgi:2-isopropylmalate synthase
MRQELAKIVQAVADGEGTELASHQLWAIFEAQYLDPQQPLLVLKELQTDVVAGHAAVNASLVLHNGQQIQIEGPDADTASALIAGLIANGVAVELIAASHEPLTDHRDASVAAYATVQLDGRTWYGAGLANAEPAATLRAITSAVNRALIAARAG